jgi:hypothetical protein
VSIDDILPPTARRSRSVGSIAGGDVDVAGDDVDAGQDSGVPPIATHGT